MHAHQFLYVIYLLYIYSYYILYPLVVVEGPIITVIAGFLASTNFLDPLPAYLTIIAGNLTGDILFYYAGKYWFKKTYRRIPGFFKITEEKLDRLEFQLKRHSGKVLFFGKMSHIFGVIILIASGIVEIPLGEFLFFCLLAELPKSLILFGVGYVFGSTISNFGRYVNITIIGLFFFTLILIGLYFVVTYFSNKFIKRLEK